MIRQCGHGPLGQSANPVEPGACTYFSHAMPLLGGTHDVCDCGHIRLLGSGMSRSGGVAPLCLSWSASAGCCPQQLASPGTGSLKTPCHQALSWSPATTGSAG